MLKKLSVIFIGIFVLAFVLDGLAEAARMGGGRSFGSKPSYQRSYSKPTAPQRDTRQANPAQPQQGPIGRPGGLFGGWGGMLGGLVMGGLIGSFLFGGMRGFSGPGLLDILVIAGGLFFLFRYLRSRRQSTQSAGAMSYEAEAVDYSSTGSGRGGGWGGTIPEKEDASPRIPADFKVDEFMKGAKAAYGRLQESWNKRDLEDIRQFTSPEVWEEIHRQSMEDPAPGKTQIVMVKAQLLEVDTVGEDMIASVYFDVLMRESPEEERPKQVREVWHFSHKAKVPGSFWRLEGIQQLED